MTKGTRFLPSVEMTERGVEMTKGARFLPSVEMTERGVEMTERSRNDREESK